MTRTHLPCEDCGSSDALTEYDDHTYCFSCGAHRWTKDLTSEEKYTILSIDTRGYLKGSPVIDNNHYTYQYISWRGISKETYATYEVKAKISEQGVPISVHFPYGEDAEKVREISDKKFYATGKMADKGVFGKERFSKGSAKAITITEGELDCLSVYEMMGKYPCVSVRGAQSARKDCEKDYDYINSFDQIKICFDNDEHGRKAAAEVARLFDPNKVFVMELGNGCKDANDYLTQGKQKEFSSVWWNAKSFHPKGIVSSYDEIKEILEQASSGSVATYPFPTLQDMTYGLRLGELILVKAKEKIGKTEFMRAIEYHLLKTTDDGVGIIHLEEGEKRSVQGLTSYELRVPCHLPDVSVSVDDQLVAYKNLTKRDGRLFFYTHFGSEDPDVILDTVRYLVTVCGCKWVFLDHITMLVTGYEGDDERKKLDYISTRLAMLTRELGFTLFLVSHVNDDGETRGSRNIGKVADLILYLDRDIEANDFDSRHTTSLRVQGNRFFSKSGPAGYLWFDEGTYTLSEKNIDHVVEGPF